MMNYMGSISILDRGDAPAQAIIDKNARSLAQRVADETKQELEKVMTRVENIYESYESSTQALFETQANLEYVEDIAELEELIKDQIKKKKYQQQVTIFIVGYENVCGQKLKLLQQVNEFFMDNTKSYVEEDWYPKTPDIDLDNCGTKIEETITTAKQLTEKLGDLNAEMIEWLTSYAVNKASTKSKKKLETALSKAKDDIKTITEQLKGAQSANDEKDEMLNSYLKQLEGKIIEVQKFKAAAEVAKKNIQEMEKNEAIYKDEMQRRDNKIKEMAKKLQETEMNLNETNFMQDLSTNRVKDQASEYQIRIEELQTQLDKGKFVIEEARRELQALHNKQILDIHESHNKELEELKAAHLEELQKVQEDILERQQQLVHAELEAQHATEQAEQIRQELFDLQLRGSPADSRPADTIDGGEGDDGVSQDDSRQESRPSTKDTKSSRSTAGKGPARVTTQVKVTAKSNTKETKTTGKSPKETVDTAVQDEGGDPNTAHVETRQSKRTRSTLETVKEAELSGDYDNNFDLTDEESWAGLPVVHLPGRFIQYRKLTRKKLLDLEDQLNLTVAKTQRKVNTLKSQFQEHKGKWEAERKVLIEQVEQAQKLQNEAEKEADVAMTQLEEFINEQEKLEEEEEVKRQEVVKSVNSVSVKLPKTANVQDIATQVDSQRGSSPQTITPVEGLAEGQREPLTTREPTTILENVPESTPQPAQKEDSEQELSKLMQQTDDAKYERQRSDIKVISRRSSSVGSDGAPWLHGGGSVTKQMTESSSDQEDDERSTSSINLSKTKFDFRTQSEKVNSEMSKIQEPSEAEETAGMKEKEASGERHSPVAMVTSDAKLIKESSVTSRRSSESRQGQRPIASKRSSTTRESSRSNPAELEKTDDAQDEGQRSRSSAVVLEDLEDLSKNSQSDAVETANTLRSRRSSLAESRKRIGSRSRSRRGSRVETQSRSNEGSPTQRQGSSIIPVISTSRQSSSRESFSSVPGESRPSIQGMSIGVPEELRPSVQGSSSPSFDPTEEDSSREPTESRGGSIQGISRKGTLMSGQSSLGRVTMETTLLSTEATEDEIYFNVEITKHPRSVSRQTTSRQKLRSSHESLERSPRSQGQMETSSSSHVSSGQAQEMHSRIASGAMSAPPAVEESSSRTGSDSKNKYITGVRSPPPRSISRGSVMSQIITRGMANAAPIEEMSEMASSGQSKSRSNSGCSSKKEAWLTPRLTPRKDFRGDDEISIELGQKLPISQASAVNNVKEMMEEEKLSSIQQRTLESVRSAIKTVNNSKDLTDVQLQRTITLISLASQLTEESLQLGILPDSIFDAFSDINSRDISTASHGDEDYCIEDTSFNFLRPFARDAMLNHEELPTGFAFIPELSQTSLKSLPALDNLLWTSQSQRLTGRQRGYARSAKKINSAPLEKLARRLEMKRAHDLFDKSQSMKKLNSFNTHATKGSALNDTASTSRSQESIEQLSRSRTLRKYGKRSPDLIDEGYDDAEIYIYRGNQVCDRGSSPASIGQINISGKTEEEIRTSSALSRASLRNQYKNKLGEVRAAVEDRRAKSPAISIPSQRSLEEDQLIDEEDDLPFTDEVKELKVREFSMDIGTSPPPGAVKDEPQVSKGSRASSVVTSEHPVVGEYLKAYEGVIHFRNALSKLMLDREMLQPSQILADIDTIALNKERNIEPQLENMTDNLYHVLEEIIGVLGAMLLADREPMVSSLNGGMLMSRDGTQHYPQPERVSADSGRGPTVTRASQHSSKMTPYSATSDKMALRELQELYEKLQMQFTEEGRRHEEQLRHNTVVMMEMQDTINELQRELANLGRSSSRLRPGSDIASPQDSAVMFTRLDSERNAKIMKRAVNDQKMDSEKYKDAVNKMDDYVSLPAQRLAHLVRKYVHHCRMKEIEENVKKSKSLNENVFEILDKMEALQNQRAKKWADRMDEMGAERLRLANLLMETLDSIEQESGIFLIKPMYSYRGRDVKDTRFGGKLTRPLRPQRHVSPNRELQSAFAPAPTPASNVRSLVKQGPLHPHYQQPIPPEQLAVKSGPVQPLEGDETGVMGASMSWVGTAAARQTWSLNSSVVRGDPEAGLANHMNTPRILELDINRMLIGQNTISSKMSQQGMTEDRLVNASQNNLRSYITVNRPSASPSQQRQPSMTFMSSTTKEFVPPSSPASTNTKRVRMSDVDIPRNIPSTPPLPPIPTGSATTTHETLAEPPRSPPGSSLRQTPPHVQEVISPLK